MFDEPWVPAYLFVVIFFSLVPIVLICSCIIRVCILELEERANELREKYKENMQTFIVNTAEMAQVPATIKD